jgi:hypothetical protein
VLERYLRGIKYVYYNNKSKIGEKNDEEERQYRVGDDDSQENAFGRNDLLLA